METGKTHPFIEHLADGKGAGGAEAGFSGWEAAKGVAGWGGEGTGARQG